MLRDLVIYKRCVELEVVYEKVMIFCRVVFLDVKLGESYEVFVGEFNQQMINIECSDVSCGYYDNIGYVVVEVCQLQVYFFFKFCSNNICEIGVDESIQSY